MALQNLFGNLGLDQTLQLIAVYLEQLAQSQTRMYPDTTGAMRTVINSGTVTTVTTVSTVTNQAQQGGINTQYDQYSQIQQCADVIRSRITVS